MTSHPAHPLFAFIRRCGSVRITLSKSPVARVVPLVRSPTSPPPSPASASGSPVARVVPLPLLGVGLAHVGVLAVAGAVTEVVTAVLTASVPAPGHAAAEWEGRGVLTRAEAGRKKDVAVITHHCMHVPEPRKMQLNAPSHFPSFTLGKSRPRRRHRSRTCGSQSALHCCPGGRWPAPEPAAQHWPPWQRRRGRHGGSHHLHHRPLGQQPASLPSLQEGAPVCRRGHLCA